MCYICCFPLLGVEPGCIAKTMFCGRRPERTTLATSRRIDNERMVRTPCKSTSQQLCSSLSLRPALSSSVTPGLCNSGCTCIIHDMQKNAPDGHGRAMSAGGKVEGRCVVRSTCRPKTFPHPFAPWDCCALPLPLHPRSNSAYQAPYDVGAGTTDRRQDPSSTQHRRSWKPTTLWRECLRKSRHSVGCHHFRG